MGEHARIETGYIAIDTTAWLDQRTGGPLPDLTDDLHAWAARHRNHADTDGRRRRRRRRGGVVPLGRPGTGVVP